MYTESCGTAVQLLCNSTRIQMTLNTTVSLWLMCLWQDVALAVHSGFVTCHDRSTTLQQCLPCRPGRRYDYQPSPWQELRQ